MSDKVMVLKDAKPCARCGGRMELDRFDPPNGVVVCLSCGHSFEVLVGVVEHGPKPRVEFESRVRVDFTGEADEP
jgi:hypothetical protein